MIDSTATSAPPAAAASRVAVPLAAVLLGVAAGIHAYVTPEHLREWWPAGAFFAMLAGGQALLAILIVRRPRPVVLLCAIATTAGVVCLYVWSRTAGLPFVPGHAAEAHGPGSSIGHAVGGRGNGIPLFPGDEAHAGAEAVGVLDLAVLLVELSAIVVLVALLPAAWRRRASTALLACGLGLLVLQGTALT